MTTDGAAVRTSRRRARTGDCVKIQLDMVPENGFVPESLFDTQGTVDVILGWGDALPGLHELLQGKAVGDSVSKVSIDAGWGMRRDDLVLQVPKSKLSRFTKNTEALAVGDRIQLNPNMEVTVTDITGDGMVTVDANHPLAGSSYSCSFTVLQIDALPESFAFGKTSCMRAPDFPYELASFSLGCFWGAQSAFDRLSGVIGTRVGYTQGLTTDSDPTYEKVCQGATKHRETVLVVYDPSVVSYERLVRLALERLAVTTSSLELHRLFEPAHLQYQHGCFYHTPEQREIARRELEHNKFGMELLPAADFYEAEEEHQKYLYKGGQSQKKESRQDIRCFG